MARFYSASEHGVMFTGPTKLVHFELLGSRLQFVLCINCPVKGLVKAYLSVNSEATIRG